LSDIPQVDFPLDHFELVVLRVGPEAQRMDAATVQRLQGEHVAYLVELRRAGKLLAAGAVAPRAPDQLITGIGFFQQGSADAVRQLMSNDPSVVGGLESAEVVDFFCPRGSLSFLSVV
jgi:uncharacterized protein YciI